MNIVTLLPFIVIIGAMFLMTRSAKKKQQQAAKMRDQMQPGTGIRTIGGMYATVKEVGDDTVLLEVAPGVHALYAKNSVGAVLEAEEFDRILHGAPADDLELDGDAPVVPDDASELTAGDEDGRIDLGKSGSGDPAGARTEDEDLDGDTDEAGARDAKRDGDADSK